MTTSPARGDWLARGLRTEGEAAGRTRAHHFASAEVVIARVEERAEDIARRIGASSFPFALVASGDGTVLGRLPQSLAGASSGKRADEVMQPGASTTRGDTEATTVLDRLKRDDLSYAIVTTPEGRLIGVVRRSDIEAARRRG
jgi:CBS domain-containing protein